MKVFFVVVCTLLWSSSEARLTSRRLEDAPLESDFPSATPVIASTGVPSTSSPTTSAPVAALSDSPSASPTKGPTDAPVTATPTASLSDPPSASPTKGPTDLPETATPSAKKSDHPSLAPSAKPSVTLTNTPTASPFETPSGAPTRAPIAALSDVPSVAPSVKPTFALTDAPSGGPSESPSEEPSGGPTAAPSDEPSGSPTSAPTEEPSFEPSTAPSEEPSAEPTTTPSSAPSLTPSTTPSSEPTTTPSLTPSSEPSLEPSSEPSSDPSGAPVRAPVVLETQVPVPASVVVPAPTPSPLPVYPLPEIFINAGIEEEDKPYISGTYWASYYDTEIQGIPVEYQQVAEAFKSHRSGSNFRYTIPGLLAYASYEVTLGFAENYVDFCQVGSRQFNVTVNGKEFVSDLDVFDTVGCNTALVLKKNYRASPDGKIIIQFSPSPLKPMVAMIGINPNGPIKSLTLVKAVNQTAIGKLGFGDEIDLEKIGTDELSIRANAIAAVTRVRFRYNGIVHTEHVSPYAMNGGDGDHFFPVPYLASNGEKTIWIDAFNDDKDQSDTIRIDLSVVGDETFGAESDDTVVLVPSILPSSSPSDTPSSIPSDVPSALPSDVPSALPSDVPSALPSSVPSDAPSAIPSAAPSHSPTAVLSDAPSSIPSDGPSTVPSDEPSSNPSAN